MITAIIKQVLSLSGCTFVVYDQQQLVNLYTDQSNQNDVIGVIFQQNTIMLEVRANAIHEHYNPLMIDIAMQVDLEDSADINEWKLQATLNICKEIITRLINMAEFKTITPVSVNRIFETKYDANVIGWSMALDLYYLLNENKYPCVSPAI